jgi:hypothetical protein
MFFSVPDNDWPGVIARRPTSSPGKARCKVQATEARTCSDNPHSASRGRPKFSRAFDHNRFVYRDASVPVRILCIADELPRLLPPDASD